MKLIVLKNNFKKGLEIVGRITGEVIGSLPILKNILIEIKDNKIIFTSTNLELAIITNVPGKVVEEGSLTIPFGVTNTLINNITSERINCEVEGISMVLQTDNYQAKLQGIKKEEFPIIPEINKENKHIGVKTESLKSALMAVMGSAHISDTKPELHGVFMEVSDEGMVVAATDGVRLAEKKIPPTHITTKEKEKHKVIVPLKTIQEVVRIITPEEGEYIDIYIDQNQIMFKTENTTIISRLINGEFPEYQAIIPQSYAIEVVVNKEQITQALKLVGSVTDKLSEVKVIVKNDAKNIELYAYNQNLGENQYLIPAKIKNTGEKKDREMIFNWKFLIEGMKNINSEGVVIGIIEDNKPAVIKSPEDHSYCYVVMPIKSF